MKRLFTLTLLASAALASIAPPSFGGTFGLFYWGRCCCGNGCCVHPYNAFTPVCCGGCGVADLGCGGGCGYVDSCGPKCGLLGHGVLGCHNHAWKHCCDDDGPGAFGTDGCNKAPYICCPQKHCHKHHHKCCVPACICPPAPQPCCEPCCPTAGPGCGCCAPYAAPSYAWGAPSYPTAPAVMQQGYPTAPAIAQYQGYGMQPVMQPVSYQYGYPGYQAYPMGYGEQGYGY
jgi:hypothetical protein